MAWYEVQKWKNDIKKNYQTNTPFAVIRAVILYSSQHDIEIGFVSREHFIVESLGWFVSQNNIATTQVYNNIKDIASYEPETLGELEQMVSTNIPKWFAESCSKGEIPLPPEHMFEFTSYNIEQETLQKYGDVFPFNILNVILYSPLNDPDLLMKYLEKINNRELIRFVNESIHTNISLITESMLLNITRKLAYTDIKEFINSGTIDSKSIFMMNIPVKTIYEYDPDFWKTKDVDILYIIMNPRITLHDYEEYCIYSGRGIQDQDFVKMSKQNTQLLLEYIRNGFIPRDKEIMSSLSCSKDLKIEDILSTDADIGWDWEIISRNPEVATPKNIREHPEIPWVWGRWGVTTSPSIDDSFMEEHLLSLYKHSRYDGSLSSNIKISSDFVRKHPEIEWMFGYSGLSLSENIKLPFLFDSIGMPWDMTTIVQNVILCENTAAQAIQSWWKLCILKYNCKELSKAVVEWYYHPECKVMMNIRKKDFIERMSCI